MNLFDALREKVDAVQGGAHSLGLQAVLNHAEVSIRHLERGRAQVDDTAFADAIYRCNQAFEGSIKEAYRVLAEKNPSKCTPFEIEKYLENEEVLHERVLNQFTTYRKDWRNPSTHNYLLNFSDSEAFLAIVSVLAFACVLLDQIVEKLAYNSAVEASKKMPVSAVSQTENLFERTSTAVLEFSNRRPGISESALFTEVEIVGALRGYVSQQIPNAHITGEAAVLFRERSIRPDLVVEEDGCEVVVEVKRFRSRQILSAGKLQIEEYLSIMGVSEGILLLMPEVAQQTEMQTYITHGKSVAIILPTA